MSLANGHLGVLQRLAVCTESRRVQVASSVYTGTIRSHAWSTEHDLFSGAVMAVSAS